MLLGKFHNVLFVEECIRSFSKSLPIHDAYFFVFCLTDKPSFFELHKFRSVDRMQLPRKVWTECYRCAKFPDCDEVAMIAEMGLKPKSA